MWRFWQRTPTIGDIIADSIDHDPQQWEVEWSRPTHWVYRNDEKGWTLSLFSSIYTVMVAFDQCALTKREERRIVKAISRMSKNRRERERATFLRRQTIKVV